MKNKAQDYRDYLKELIENKKSSRASNSSADYARKLKISRSFLAQVFAKKKHLSLEKLNDLCVLLKVPPGDSMALLENFLEQIHSAKYLATSVRKAKNQYFSYEKSTVGKLTSASRTQKNVLGDPLKSILLAACCSDIGLAGIQKALHLKDIEISVLKKNLTWLADNDFLSVKVANGEVLYKSKNPFVTTDRSATGVAKYLPWLPYIERTLMNPIDFIPGRIQSHTGHFDDAAIAELIKAGDEYRQRFLELSDNSSLDKAKILYLQNIFFTLATRE
jgi:transcriptional regulator with XRE-family HTH domain